MKKKSLLSLAPFLALLCACGNSSAASESSFSSEKDETDGRDGCHGVLIGDMGKTIYLKEGGSYTIKSMEIGNGVLKLSGDFDVDREADDFAAYMQFGSIHYAIETLTFELSSKLEKGWSMDLHGEMEFSFTLPDDIRDFIREKTSLYIHGEIYTDFGLGSKADSSGYSYRDETGQIAHPDAVFYAPLGSLYFVGDLEGVYTFDWEHFSQKWWDYLDTSR